MKLLLLMSGLLLLTALGGCATEPAAKRGFLDWKDVTYDPDGTIRCDQPYCR